jgi:hypothetical protein
MQGSRDNLIHEAASLYRLVDSIERFVAEHENIFAYTDATQSFFSEVHKHARNTKESVSQITKKLLEAPDLSEPESRYKGELIIQKNRWKTLHTYIKPATDAHTLNVPEPLIEMATKHLRSIPGLETTAIVVLLTPHLMYYQTPQSHFPPHLVFVEIPYSQGPCFFTNLTIYHELGHYVFDRLARLSHF